MALKKINLGTAPTGVGGDTNRTANEKMNLNIDEIELALESKADKTTPAQGRSALGLGSAATENVTENGLDSTSGRLLCVGDFGLGGGPRGGGPTDCDAATANGFYYMADASENKPGVRGGALTVAGPDSGARLSSQIFAEYAPGSIFWRTSNTPGEWGDWAQFRHTRNTTVDSNGILHNGTSVPAGKQSVTEDRLGEAALRGVVGGEGRPLMAQGANGFGAVGNSSRVDDLNALKGVDTRIVYFNTSSTGTPTEYGVALSIVTAAENSSQLAMGYRIHDGLHWRPLFGDNLTWFAVRHEGNTTVDGNGFIKNSSPIIKLHSDRIESDNVDGSAFERIDTGHYQLTGCNGLRLDDGWYIETPHDRNKVPYFNVEWEQDIEPETDAGVLEEPADVTLSVRCYERVWNPQTGTYDNGEPVDIPDGRWIDLRMNEVRQPEPEEPEMPVEPELQPEIPTEPSIPSVVTMAQAKLALLYAGIYEQAESFIHDLPEPQKAAALIEWNHRQTLERWHPLVAQVAAALELTEEQLDELFVDAAGR